MNAPSSSKPVVETAGKNLQFPPDTDQPAATENERLESSALPIAIEMLPSPMANSLPVEPTIDTDSLMARAKGDTAPPPSTAPENSRQQNESGKLIMLLEGPKIRAASPSSHSSEAPKKK